MEVLATNGSALLRLAVFVLLFAVLGVSTRAEAATQDAVDSPAASTAISAVAGFCYCAGWWTLTVEPPNRLSVDVTGEAKLARELTAAELSTLSRLLSDLPKDEPRYHFGKSYVDVTPLFILEIGRGSAHRKYSVTGALEEELDHPDVRPILRVWTLLRRLFDSKLALDPPPVPELPHGGGPEE